MVSGAFYSRGNQIRRELRVLWVTSRRLDIVCVLRWLSATDSALRRPLIPLQTGH